MKMRVCCLLVPLLLATSAHAAGQKYLPLLPATGGPITPQEYFLYRCVLAYMEANSIPVFDASVVAAEQSEQNMNAPWQVVKRLDDAAIDYARRIKPPVFGMQEGHGLAPVLHHCNRESQTPRVAELGRRRKGEGE